MPGNASQPEPLSHTTEKKGGNGKKVGIIVAVVAVVAVGVFVFLNRDGLRVNSEVSTPPETTPTETLAPNQYPEIVSLTVASDRIEPFSLCDLVCEATDPDGDVLTYEWTASAGDIYGDGAEVQWGSPVSEGLYRVSVVVTDPRGGTAEYSVPLRVQANAAPVLSELTADSDWVVGGGSTRVACVASDADGDDISLEWSATAGEFFGEGDAVFWAAPQEDGVYWIVVEATDAYGGFARRAIPVSVSTGEPPAIDGLFVKGVNTDMLRKVGNDWMIYQGRSCSVTCAVLEHDTELTYEWSADFGTLDADGPIATWTSPASRVAATIVVVVTDERGNQSSASVLINVETCTCSF